MSDKPPRERPPIPRKAGRMKRVIPLPATPEEIAKAQEIANKRAALGKARAEALAQYRFQRVPGGRKVGSRNRLQGAFIAALADDFDKWGKHAIQSARETDPMGYVRVIATLMPKQVEQTTPLEELSDDELAAGIDLLRSRLSIGHAQGVGQEADAESLIELHPVPKTA